MWMKTEKELNDNRPRGRLAVSPVHMADRSRGESDDEK
jgi:hypothetical protein